MTLYQIKPLFQSLLRPTMFWLYKHHVTANHITLAALALSLTPDYAVSIGALLSSLLLPCAAFIVWHQCTQMACWRVVRSANAMQEAILDRNAILLPILRSVTFYFTESNTASSQPILVILPYWLSFAVYSHLNSAQYSQPLCPVIWRKRSAR